MLIIRHGNVLGTLFLISTIIIAYRWLLFERMKFSIHQEHGLGLVLVMMGEGIEALREVEAKDDQSKGANQMLLEGDLRQLRFLHNTFR